MLTSQLLTNGNKSVSYVALKNEQKRLLRIYLIGRKRRRIQAAVLGVVEPHGHPRNARVVDSSWKSADGELARARYPIAAPLQADLRKKETIRRPHRTSPEMHIQRTWAGR